MKKTLNIIVIIFFIISCSKNNDRSQFEVDLSSLGITIDSLGNYSDSLGNLVTIDSYGNVIQLGIRTDSLGNYIDSVGNLVSIDPNGNITIIEVFQGCIGSEGFWSINPSCDSYEIPLLSISVDVNERFDDSINVLCNYNTVNIDFGSDQTAYANIGVDGKLIIPLQTIVLDFQNSEPSEIEFLPVSIFGKGSLDPSTASGSLDINFKFELLPGLTDTVGCVLTLHKL